MPVKFYTEIVFSDSPEFKGGICVCGKANMPIHCRICGSSNVYGCDKASQLIVQDDKTVIKYHGFRCRKCGELFNLAFECEAPRFVSKSMKARRDEDTAREDLTAALEAATKGLTDPDEIRAAKAKVIGEVARRKLLEMDTKGRKQ